MNLAELSGTVAGSVLLVGCQQSGGIDNQLVNEIAGAPSVAVDPTPRAQAIHSMLEELERGDEAGLRRLAPSARYVDGDALGGTVRAQDIIPPSSACRLAAVLGPGASGRAAQLNTVMAVWACRGESDQIYARRRFFTFNGDVVDLVETGAPVGPLPEPVSNSNGG